MRVFDVRTIAYRTRAEYEARQCPVYDLYRVEAENVSEALRVAAWKASDNAYYARPIDAYEVRNVPRI